jgi:hypothetical protein
MTYPTSDDLAVLMADTIKVLQEIADLIPMPTKIAAVYPLASRLEQARVQLLCGAHARVGLKLQAYQAVDDGASFISARVRDRYQSLQEFYAQPLYSLTLPEDGPGLGLMAAKATLEKVGYIYEGGSYWIERPEKKA